MNGKQLLGLILAIVVVVVLIRIGRDPLRTALPFGSTDLSSVDKPLQRLSAEERSLVEDYVRRSNGDVLPEKFADPDDPLTARTFGEAIALQRRWKEHMRAQEAVAATHAAERDRAMAPLREAVEAKVIRREILPADQVNAAQTASTGGTKVAHSANDRSVFVITVAIYNHGNSDVVDLKGSLEAKDRDNYLPLNLCWVDVGAQQPVPAYGRIDIRCANVARQADANERAFVDDPPGRFDIVWAPKSIKFADGKTLDSHL